MQLFQNLFSIITYTYIIIITNNIIDRFLYKDFQLINGKPTYTTIKSVNDKLSTNTSAKYSTLSDGRHGLLGLVIPSTIYNTITNVPFIRPLNPGARPIIPTNATA